jgi:hypothetical protein
MAALLGLELPDVDGEPIATVFGDTSVTAIADQ